jgi:hypothetical protein
MQGLDYAGADNLLLDEGVADTFVPRRSPGMKPFYKCTADTYVQSIYLRTLRATLVLAENIIGPEFGRSRATTGANMKYSERSKRSCRISQ